MYTTHNKYFVIYVYNTNVLDDRFILWDLMSPLEKSPLNRFMEESLPLSQQVSDSIKPIFTGPHNLGYEDY